MKAETDALAAEAAEREKVEHLREVVAGFQTAMLVSHAEDGALRARPMSVAEVDPQGDVWFATALDSGKSEELEHDERAAVIFQNSKQFVSLSGSAEFVFDRVKQEAMWTEAWRPWFPGGAADPKLVLLKIRCSDAELWDLTGMKGVRYWFEAVRHAMRGERMNDDERTYHSKAEL